MRQKGLQEPQNAALSQDKQPIESFARQAFIAVRLICTLYGQPRRFGVVTSRRCCCVCNKINMLPLATDSAGCLCREPS